MLTLSAFGIFKMKTEMFLNFVASFNMPNIHICDPHKQKLYVFVKIIFVSFLRDLIYIHYVHLFSYTVL